jgi:hypothetical protein
MAGQRVISRLQNDLGHWGLVRLLPFSSVRLLVAELILPWMLVVLLGWITLAIASNTWSGTSPLLAALLLLCTSASISFAAAYDLLLQAKPEMLLNGSAPQASSVGGLLSILCVALTLGVWFGLERIKLNGSIPAIALAVLLALFFWRLAGKWLQELG